MNGSWLIIIFLLSMVYLFVTIVRFKMNPFFSMLTASILIGLLVKMDLGKMVTGITSGFGSVMSSLGIVIALGGLLGAFLAAAGATDSLANYMLDKVGEKKAGLAMNITGYIISIPVFFGAAYIVLNPILRVLSRKTKKPIQVYITALSVGLLVTHCMVIPTPGPLTVASTLGVNIGWCILSSLMLGLPAALSAGWLYGEYRGKKIPYVEPPMDAAELEHLKKDDRKNAPAGLAIFLITLPLVLIVMGTILPMFVQALALTMICSFLTTGNGVISLLISVGVAAWTLKPYIDGKYAPLVTKSFNEFGEIFMLLGAGGSFGAIVQASGIGDYFVGLLKDWNISLIILAFILCLLLRTALGSAAVAMVTTSSIVAPICLQMGVNPIILGLSICAASLAIATPTDAAFWIVQKMDNLSIKDTVLTYTMGNVLASAILLALVMLLNACQGFLPGLAM
ncbi:MAG: GntP family permease [Clostridium sp.]|nr:GntP family permease [Clostridium sp.]